MNPSKNISKGCFVTLEGIEGVGKSTNIALIVSMLEMRNIRHITTREPGGTVISEKIRTLLLDKKTVDMTAITELSLAFAARAQHVETLIKPTLSQGIWVISDRFTDSSYAYQGAGRGLGAELVAKLEALTIGDFQPDITFLFDLPVETGLERAAKRAKLDRFEQEQQAFFERVRDAYLARSQCYDRFRVINAGRPLEQVQGDVSVALGHWIDKWQC